MRRFFFFLLFFCSLIWGLSCEGHTLLDEFSAAQAGDFVVFSKQKHYILFHFAEVLCDEFVIEEVTVLQDSFPQIPVDWKGWIAKKAPNYASWNRFIVDRKTGALESSYTLKEGEWIKTSTSFPFLPQLFTLPLEKVPQEEQKKVGPPPEEAREDLRKAWRPKCIVDGKPLEPVPPFDVFRTRYKEDGALSDKVIYLYFPRSQKALSYFPYWIEVMQIVGKETLQVVDSGKELKTQSPLVMNKKPLLSK